MKHVPLQLLEGLACSKCSQRTIAHKLSRQGIRVSRSTVRRRITELGLCGSRNTKLPSKNQSSDSARLKRYMVRLVRLHHCTSTARVHSELKMLGYDVSRRTVLRRLKLIQFLHFGFPRQRQRHTVRQQAERLRWARAALSENVNWTNVFFADEKVWLCDGPARRPKLWYDKRDAPLVLPRKGAVSKSLALWGAFSVDRAPDLQLMPTHINSEQYCNAIEAGLLSGWS